MKSTLFLIPLTAHALAAPAPERLTPDGLAHLQRTSPMKRYEDAPDAGKNVARPTDQSIIAQSVILHDGKNWTLVPKGAVMFVPPSLKDRVDVKPLGNLLPFGEFLIANRGWISTTEVSFDQASGKEPLPTARTEFWPKQDKVIVAVHRNGPISVSASPTDPSISSR